MGHRVALDTDPHAEAEHGIVPVVIYKPSPFKTHFATAISRIGTLISYFGKYLPLSTNDAGTSHVISLPHSCLFSVALSIFQVACDPALLTVAVVPSTALTTSASVRAGSRNNITATGAPKRLGGPFLSGLIITTGRAVFLLAGSGWRDGNSLSAKAASDLDARIIPRSTSEAPFRLFLWSVLA